jgi:hypothetical protein
LTPSGGWGTAERIELDDAGSAYGPQVAVDASGNVVAAWMHSVDTVGIATAGAVHHVWSNRWTPSGGWGTAEPIETNNSDDGAFSQVAQVVVDVSGNVVAVWPQWDGTREDLWSNRWTTSGGWGTAERIETDGTGSAYRPQVAVDASGNAVVVWYQWDGTRDSIWSNRWTPSGGWGTAERIETDDAEDARGPQVAIDAIGDAVAVWQRFDTTLDRQERRASVWSNRWTPSGGWGTAERINTEDADTFRGTYPQVAVDAIGNAVAVWSQSSGAGQTGLWSNRFEKE